MTSKTQQSIATDPDTGAIALCAIRYAMGRRTYMPSLVADWLKRHWLALPERDRVNIARDLKEAIEWHEEGRLSLGDDCDVWTWRGLNSWIETQTKVNQ